MFAMVDPSTKLLMERKRRQQQALFYSAIGLVLGGSVMFLLMELIQGVSK